VDALATGAGTYAHIEHLDPLPFGGRPVFVSTRRRRPRPGHLLAAVTSSRAGALERWNSLGLDRVYVDGGALISEFLAHALVDDLVLTTVPVLLGSGVPLFHPVLVKTALWLEAVTSWPSGVVNLSCSRVQKGRP